MNLRQHVKYGMISLVAFVSVGPVLPDQVVGSCFIATQGICFNYMSGYTTSSAQASCTQQSMQYSPNPCNLANVAGTCTVTFLNQKAQMLFDGAKYTKAFVQSQCQSQLGVFNQ